MRFVTTCHKEGYESYGHRLLEGWFSFPKEAELWWYTEGYDIPEVERVVQRDINQIADLVSFKKKYADYIPPSFDMDAVRFSHKVYAAVDALIDYDGIGVWVDADCVPFKPMSREFFANMLNGAYMACFQRKGFYTETGLWVVDCSHEVHKPFMATWLKWYGTDKFKSLPGWTDCHTLDATLHVSKVKVEDLSKGCAVNELHPMAKTEIGKYLDHCKGERKYVGFSKENDFHVEARNAAA